MNFGGDLITADLDCASSPTCFFLTLSGISCIRPTILKYT